MEQFTRQEPHMVTQEGSAKVRVCRMNPVKTGRANHPVSIPASRVKELLREIAIAMHATQVVGWKGGVRAPKKG
jgi:hypothetical protein